MCLVQPVQRRDDFDLVCIGAGPGNMALCERLLDLRPSTRILIVEFGRRLGVRLCPLATIGKSPPCPRCHAVHGVAGAGAYSDGKVSFWPAGSGLATLAGSDEKVSELDEALRGYFAPIRGTESSCTTFDEAQSYASRVRLSSLRLTPYEVVHAGSEAIQEFYAGKEAALIQRGVSFLPSTKVESIASDGQRGFRVRVSGVAWHRSVTAAAVCLGVGKAFGRWLRGTFRQLGVQTTPSEIEVGVRIEFPYLVTSEAARCHRDAKYSIRCSDGSEVRTFCFCHRGYVLGAYYADMITVSGFSLRDKESNNTNLAVVNRFMPSAVDPYEAVLPMIQRQNASSESGITVQTIGDFIDGRASTHASINCAAVIPTLGNAAPGLITVPYNATTHRNLIAAIHEFDRQYPGFAAPDNLLYGPVLEKCWDKVNLDRMRTSVQHVYVVGDATGHARGLLQAAASGWLGAEAIAEDLG